MIHHYRAELITVIQDSSAKDDTNTPTAFLYFIIQCFPTFIKHFGKELPETHSYFFSHLGGEEQAVHPGWPCAALANMPEALPGDTSIPFPAEGLNNLLE